MSENRPQNKKTDKARHPTRYFWSALLIVLAVAIVCCLMLWMHLRNFSSIDAQLASIEAALAIPDAENAAVHYTRFFTDPNNAAILYDLSYQTPSAYIEPWAGSEHPELAAELKKSQAFIQTLLDVSEMQKARFPIYPGSGSNSWQILADMRKVTFILSWAAANDLAEGRIDAAYGKYRCQLKLARQLQQQPGIYYRNVGIAIEAVASGNIRRAVMRDEITTEQLRSLETILEIPRNQNEAAAEVAARVDRLIEEKERSELSFPARFHQWLLGYTARRQRQQRQRLILLRLEASWRAAPILIALRRHKEKTGEWPETLEQIEPKPPEQILTAPQNNGPFIYKRDGDDFVFYSKGPNTIDEGGSYSGSADDWPIWPLKIK